MALHAARHEHPRSDLDMTPNRYIKTLRIGWWPFTLATVKTSSSADREWVEFISQSAIFTGPIGAMLLGSGSRWGFVIGLAVQPFWFYTSFRHRQWGIFIASIFYAFGWAIGVYRNF